ncbi:hypothetical protein CVT25_008151 [Psilocybe cyanescens]|uniref:HMG box domain-containing protein n=1 Tax=Psilocybe cyanescens TaxID=93625 RepID=A0A409XSS8_PSICY|nr:hypothetical protein CVT25_008151 [Psilocybe cyanescens]
MPFQNSVTTAQHLAYQNKLSADRRRLSALVPDYPLPTLPNLPPLMKGEKIKRPSNAFILYRSWKVPQIQFVGRKQSNDQNQSNNASTIIAGQWKIEDPEIVNYFYDLSRLLAIEHIIRYPEYTFDPTGITKKAGAATTTSGVSQEALSAQTQRTTVRSDNVDAHPSRVHPYPMSARPEKYADGASLPDAKLHGADGSAVPVFSPNLPAAGNQIFPSLQVTLSDLNGSNRESPEDYSPWYTRPVLDTTLAVHRNISEEDIELGYTFPNISRRQNDYQYTLKYSHGSEI